MKPKSGALIALIFVLQPAIAGAGATPVAVQVVPSREPLTSSAVKPEFTAAQRAQREAGMARVNRETPRPPESPTAPLGFSQPTGQETSAPSQVAPSASNAPAVFLDRDLFGLAGASTSVVNEPSAANIGRHVFYTGNWYAAHSGNQGVSWTYINPYSGFTDFCCDQDVIYDRTTGTMIWLRMGVPDANGENRYLLSISNNGGTSFTYTYQTTTKAAGANGYWYDYPHLALTNNYLYITWNIFNASNVYQRSEVHRWFPKDLAAGNATTRYTWNAGASGTLTPAAGGTTKGYFATHATTASMRLYTWHEGGPNNAAGGTVVNTVTSIPAWTSTGRGTASCPGPDGTDACARLDDRITSCYVKRHPFVAFSQLETMGCFWTVKEGGGYNYPYINNAWFYTNSWVYGGQHLLYSGSGAFIYGAAYPDNRGNVGIAGWYSGGAYYPSFFVGKDDDTDGSPPGWGVTYPATSNDGPNGNIWGDYARVRPFYPMGTCWLASGHVLRNGGNQGDVHPYYVVFGQGRDSNSCYQNWKQQGP